MSKFTSKEKEIIENYIFDDTLRKSLSQIRECMEEVWRVDAPLIIQDFTDNGEKHCERLIGLTYKLLEANDGKKLAEYEMYLLLAGIYLHDIGLQCDIIRFPEIKNEAEKLGAEFDLDFTAYVNRYSIKEQNSIRRNHQYLSAAWISYAYKTEKTVLGSAVKTVPSKLVQDLIDVCKYHSKLPITDCNSSFTFYPSLRKKLVAALLRFSNELEINSNQTSLGTMKNFCLDPNVLLFWWLQKLTIISLINKSLLRVNITLNSEDNELYGSLIKQEFIEKFKSKNEVLLDVLAGEGIPIRIDSNSNVIEDEYVEKLPQEIIGILENMGNNDSPLEGLAEEVKTWLQVIKYEIVELKRFNERSIDIRAVGPFKQHSLIRCIEGEINKTDVDDIDLILDRKTPQGILISDKRISQKARLRASEDNALEVFTLSEFIRQKVWKQYFDILESLVEKENIPELYIDVGCYKERYDEKEIIEDEYQSLVNYIDNWLTERGTTHISLLGEFGIGRTWFCKYYAYHQLKRYLEDPINQRLPILITLRDFTKSIGVKQLVNGALLEKYKLPFVGSAFDAFQKMNQQGKILLILDGFDEMALQVDYQTVVDNFWELSKLVDKKSKVILTSRSEYFRWAEESEKIFSGKEFGRNTIVLKPPEFEVLYLKHFSNDQILEYIAKRKGTIDGPSIAEHILNQENLADMARKPLLLELLLMALDEVNNNVLENPAQVYLYATNKLLLRNIETRRTFTSTTDKLYFLCELAWEMIKREELKIHYREIPKHILSYFGNNIRDNHELDVWDFDLRNQTLLHRNAAGYYEFAHKSLAEYFVAFKFAAELGILDSLYTQTYCYELSDFCQAHFERTQICELVETFGSIELTNIKMKFIFELLCEMISINADKKLWEIIEYTKNKNPEELKYIGGNAATLLCKIGKWSIFKGINLKGADFKGANLENANFKGANLERANFEGANLEGANFEEANLKRAQDLSVDQLSKVKSLYDSKLDNELFIYLKDKCPALFEKPVL